MRCPVTEWLRQQGLRNMKFTIHVLEVMDLNPSQVDLGIQTISV